MLVDALAGRLHSHPKSRVAASLAHRVTRQWRDSDYPRIREGRLREGVRILLDVRDHAQWLIYFYGTHEEATADVFRRLLRVGETVIDVGANAGYYTLLAARYGCRVVAFEPQADLAALIGRSAIRNGFPDVTIEKAACAATEGSAALFVIDEGWGPIRTLVDDRGGNVESAVTTVTLDRYCRDNNIVPSVVKIDAEYAELAVVQGATETLRKYRPHVIAEISDPQATALLEQLGYTAHPVEDSANVYFSP